MRPLRYSINVTLDGCCHHEAGLPPDDESMRYWTAEMCSNSSQLFDFVITVSAGAVSPYHQADELQLGGDGTVLFTSWLL